MIGPLLAQAADYARGAHRLLVAAVLALDEAGADMEPAADDIAELLEDAGDFAAELIAVADDYGHREVERRRRHG